MKIKLPKEVRTALGVKKKYVDVEDVFELLWKVVKRWLKGSAKKKRPSSPKSKPSVQSRPQPQMVAKSRTNGKVAVQKSMMQMQLDQAVQYQQEIRQMGETAVSDFDQMRVDRLIVLVNDWVETVHDLALRIDNFQQNELIRRDLKEVPKAIADLEKRLEKAENPLVREELARTQVNRQRQLTSLEKLRDTMEWAEMRVESTVSMLGTIYSKLLISRSQGQVADYGRLLAEANEEVDALHDYLDALQEVKAIG
jgi:hypothetical protein